ncbi:hypothetical protein [Halosimplex sp. TS25]|uniref:hypothetical protein n=1 Tax=Halosimplex rarum TaxID=3396619 RepID=UPI0039ECC40E
MELSRRSVLSALGVVLSFSVSGCSSDSSESPTPASPPATKAEGTRQTPPPVTHSPTQTATHTTEPIPTPRNCPDEPLVDDAERDDISPVPEPPESLDDGATLAEYVADYEKAYQWQEWKGYGEKIHEFVLEIESEVTRLSDTAVIVKSDFAVVSGRVDHTGDGTPGHFDGAPYAVRYLLTTEAVWRTAKRYDTVRTVPEPDPRENGVLLECY